MSAAPFVAVPDSPTLRQSATGRAKSAREEGPGPGAEGYTTQTSDFRFLISGFEPSSEVANEKSEITKQKCIRPEPFRVGRDGTLVMPASRLQQHAALATVATGIAALDELTGGVPRGALTEVCGRASSGRTSVLLSLLARMTQTGEVCALVDASDSFDPRGAEEAGVELKRVLWVRCSDPGKIKSEIGNWQSNSAKSGANQLCKLQITDYKSSISPCLRVDAYSRRRAQMSRVEQALKAADLLLQGGGFGLVAVDFADIAAETARRVPLTSWFRFRRAVENTSTALVVLEQEPYAKTCASLVVQLSAVGSRLSVNRPTRQPSHAGLFGGLEIHAEVSRDRQQRKPVRPAKWESKARFVI